MTRDSVDTIIDLTAVVVAVTRNTPRVLIVDQHADRVRAETGPSMMRGLPGLPNGPFEPLHHASLEDGLRRWVEAQTGLGLRYVEQLYTFGNRYRDPVEIAGGPRVVSVAYITLTHEDTVRGADAEWRDWYSFFPWEDWREGRPEIITDIIDPALQRWVDKARSRGRRTQRQERVNVTFHHAAASEMDAVLCLERYELLYEAGLVLEAIRDRCAVSGEPADAASTRAIDAMGQSLACDHRRLLATALGRIRGKLAYRPVVFELTPAEFTLLQLQRVVEALSGARSHKQNFRRLVTNADLVEPVGRTNAVGPGRPAELFRFRREVLGEKLTVGLSRPVMRSADEG